jgi:hypothetical protein
MLPPPPGRLSMTTGWPRIFSSLRPTMRASTSLGPPGVKATTSVIGRAG